MSAGDEGRSAELAWTKYLDYVGPTMVQMNIAEAKAKLSELVARAEAGEEVVIARDGKPVVVMKPANDAQQQAPSGTRPIGFLSHLGQVWEAPDAWDDDDEAADFAEQSFEEDFAGPDEPRKKP